MKKIISFSAVLFDLNGVLVDDENLHRQAFREVLAAQEITLSDEDYACHFIGRTDREGLVAFLGPKADSLDLLVAEKT